MVDEKDGGEDEKKDANINSMTEHRLKKRKKEKEEKGTALKKICVYHELAKAINGLCLLLPAFEPRYHVYQPELGTRLVLLEGENKEVKIVSERAVVYDLTAFLTKKMDLVDDFQLLPREVVDAVHHWMGATDPIPEPLAVGWRDEPGFTFRRLPWSRNAHPDIARCPTWSSLLDRMENARAFSIWVGSLFVKEANLHQYVWMYGGGNDGKSAISRFLSAVFGGAYDSKQPPGRDDKHWAASLLGKRVVVFPDCNAKSFVSGGYFKSLSGGDPICIERKFKESFTARLAIKFLFLSNEMPSISSEKADLRRIILCSMKPRPANHQDDPEFEAKLWAEGGEFLSVCIKDYELSCPTHGPIESDQEEMISWVDMLEEDYERILETHFRIRPFQGPFNEAPYCLAKDMAELTKRIFMTRKEREDFYAWLKKKHSVRRAVVHPGAVSTTGEISSQGRASEKRYVGIEIIQADLETNSRLLPNGYRRDTV